MSIFRIDKKNNEAAELKSYEQIFDEQWLPRVFSPENRMDGEDEILDAVFSQYSNEFQRCSIRVTTASFNFTDGLDWEKTSNIYELYKTICHNYHIKPIDIEDFRLEQYVPYIPIPSLISFVKNTAICFLHLRKNRVKYISALSVFPSDEEIFSSLDDCTDYTISSFLLLLVALLISIESFLIDYDSLAIAYNYIVMGYLALSSKDKTKEGEEFFKKAISIFDEILKPYESRLRQESIINKDWAFSYCEIPFSIIPYKRVLGETAYYEIGALWNLSKIRGNNIFQRIQTDLMSSAKTQ